MAYSRPGPLRGKHTLKGFDCGEPSRDQWLARHARQAEAAGTARVYVTTTDGVQVVGFYALAAGGVDPADATGRPRKGEPAYRPVLVILLARLAVDRNHQGHGLGRSLLQQAVLRSEVAADSIGAKAVVVHAIAESARAWYARFGFEASPTDPLHLILLMKDVRSLIERADALGDG